MSIGPANPDAKVEVVPYNPEWPALFAAECALLEPALAQWLAGDIEHIGSTAVLGLAAKPIIDIMAPVRSLQGSRAAIEAVGRVGYVYYPYKAEVMHWFCKPSPEHRTHHLHLVEYQSNLWYERLAFRSALRGSDTLAAEYAALTALLGRKVRNGPRGVYGRQGILCASGIVADSERGQSRLGVQRRHLPKPRHRSNAHYKQ